MKIHWAVFFSLVALFGASLGQGAMLTVEKDGSGDFTVIQDAVDAANSGDTIMIGPGRFTETHDFVSYSGTIVQVCITIDKNLTLLGAGAEQTIVEPIVEGKNEYDPGGFASLSTALEVSVTDLTIANCEGIAFRFYQVEGGRLELERAKIENSHSGVILRGTSHSSLVDCFIQTGGAYGLGANGAQNIRVENCVFEGGGVSIQQSPSASNVISHCRFDQCGYGVFLANSSNTTISQCLFNEGSHTGIILSTSSSNIDIHDVMMTGLTDYGLIIRSAENLQVRDSVFHAGRFPLFIWQPVDGLVFQNNHILPSDLGWSVWAHDAYLGEPAHIDLTGNYWGTDDPEEVAAWIHDGLDDPNVNMFIDYLPMAGGPVSTTRTTMDGFKALFR